MNPTKPLTIIELRAQNVKRLSAVQIKPSGAVVVIGGQNGAGKSSVLDAIMYGLAGGEKLPKMPVRRGQAKARVVLNLGDFVVTRTFTAAGGTSLAITNKEGAKYGSPQTMLDKLTGRLTFDPLAFSRQRPADQAETLRALVGLDLSAMKQEEARLFDQRATASRMLKAAQSALDHIPSPVEGQLRIPNSVESVMKDLEAAISKNEAADVQRYELRNAEDQLSRLKRERADLQTKIDELQSLARATDNAIRVSNDQLELLKANPPAAPIDLAPLREQCKNIEAENRKVHEAVRYDEVARQVEQARQDFEQLNEAVEKVRNRQAEAIRAVKFPIEGLALDATGVTLNGIPFEQCSSAEQLRVSVAIGLAMNPKLKVLLIRDGSLLDEQSLALVADMAAQAQAQVWIERVETDGAVTVVIEDGHVKGANVEPEPEIAAEKPTSAAPKPENAAGCPHCGAPLAIGPGGTMVCTAECQAKPAAGNFANEDDVPTP